MATIGRTQYGCPFLLILQVDALRPCATAPLPHARGPVCSPRCLQTEDRLASRNQQCILSHIKGVIPCRSRSVPSPGSTGQAISLPVVDTSQPRMIHASLSLSGFLPDSDSEHLESEGQSKSDPRPGKSRVRARSLHKVKARATTGPFKCLARRVESGQAGQIRSSGGYPFKWLPP